MPHNSRSRAELSEQLRSQADLDDWKEVERPYSRRAQIGREQVSLAEFHLVSDARRVCILAAFFDSLRIDIDANREDAEPLRRSYDDPSISRAKIVKHVSSSNQGIRKHMVYDRETRRETIHIPSPHSRTGLY